MSLYLVICLLFGLGAVAVAVKKGQLAWFISGAVALSLLLGIPTISGPFLQLTQGVASVVAGVVGDNVPGR